VHTGIVGHGENKAAVGAGDGRVHEGVGGDVEANVFHAHKGPLAGPAHAQRLLVGHLLVGRPKGVDVAVGLSDALNVLEDLGRRGARVAVNAAHPGVDGAETDRLVAK